MALKLQLTNTEINNNKGLTQIYDIEYFYDTYGRLKEMKQGTRFITYEVLDSSINQVLYPKLAELQYYENTGDLHTVTDNEGNTTEYIYDEAGRVINTRQTNEDNYEIEYDKNNNPIKVTPATGKIHNFSYNKVDKVKEYYSPEVDGEVSDPSINPEIFPKPAQLQNNLTSYGYNLDGQSISTTTPDTKRIEYNYNQTTAKLDSINYMAFEGSWDTEETEVAKTINYNYDEEKDQLLNISLDNSTVSYEYDGDLLLSEVSVSTVNPEIYPKPTKLQSSSDYNSKISWDYDHELKLENIHLSSNGNNAVSINYDYNDDAQLTKAGDVSYIYDDTTGFLKSKSVSNITETYDYNEFGEVTSVNNANHNFIYTYDGIGRIKTITSSSEKSEYFYDLMGRVEYVEVDGIETERYTYDENGNRLTADFDYAQSPINATYDVQDRMETYGDNAYTYTLNGSLLTKFNSEGITEYSYDAMGNLLRVKLPENKVVTYQIDARGRRIGKKVNGVFQYGFIYGDQLNPIAKVDESGSIIEQYVYGLKGNIPEYLIKGNNKYKIISNHLGSPVMVLDMNDNSVVKEIKYDSFGNILLDSAPSIEIPFRFVGGIWDKDTKLVRFGVRDYDSETGRWTSKEPLGFNGARNFYVYVNNSPIVFRDPTGLNPIHYQVMRILDMFGRLGNKLGRFGNKLDDKFVKWWYGRGDSEKTIYSGIITATFSYIAHENKKGWSLCLSLSKGILNDINTLFYKGVNIPFATFSYARSYTKNHIPSIIKAVSEASRRERRENRDNLNRMMRNVRELEKKYPWLKRKWE